ncbi:hypothetical protein HNR59_002854 [Aquamicrobium lusatiense]|uniref:Uncharacterized protein n=1 Tax=Aquamicrobium lusatiense TaxID=89772 RepID=A0A7W9S440_9HYPH|nr:hypothetical protein [Aquamicrobium lusatiense]MBB6013465.1 hypothetical protein [Aquamicrobium lusatiense]
MPQLHWFTTCGFEGYDPLVLYDVGKEWAGAPGPSPEMMAEYGLPERMATETLAEASAGLFEAFRRTKMVYLAHPEQPVLYAVGGHVDLTTVRAEGVSVERLRNWPDVVGEKNRPELDGKAAAWMEAA